MPETMKLLGSTKSKITTDENDEIVSHLEITEVQQWTKYLGKTLIFMRNSTLEKTVIFIFLTVFARGRLGTRL